MNDVGAQSTGEGCSGDADHLPTLSFQPPFNSQLFWKHPTLNSINHKHRDQYSCRTCLFPLTGQSQAPPFVSLLLSPPHHLFLYRPLTSFFFVFVYKLQTSLISSLLYFFLCYIFYSVLSSPVLFALCHVSWSVGFTSPTAPKYPKLCKNRTHIFFLHFAPP